MNFVDQMIDSLMSRYNPFYGGLADLYYPSTESSLFSVGRVFGDYGFGYMLGGMGGSLWGNVLGAGLAVSDMWGQQSRLFSDPIGYTRGLFSYLDALENSGGPAPKKQVGAGTDSPWYAQRANGYIDETINGGAENPSSQSDILDNMFGAQPKDDAGMKAYNDLRDKESKKDNFLRAVVASVKSWIDDPKARAVFAYRWAHARDNTERALALIDPLGNGSNWQKFAGGLVDGLQNGGDLDTSIKNAEAIAKFIDSHNMGGGLFGSIGQKVMSTRSFGSEPPLTSNDVVKYKGELGKRGFDDGESSTLMSAIKTEDEAELVTKAIRGLQKTDKKERALDFLNQVMPAIRIRYGMMASDLGYNGTLPAGVTDVQTAIKWLYGKLGVSVTAVASAPAARGGGGPSPRPPRPSGHPLHSSRRLDSKTPLSAPTPDGYKYIVVVDGETYACKEAGGDADFSKCKKTTGGAAADLTTPKT